MRRLETLAKQRRLRTVEARTPSGRIVATIEIICPKDADDSPAENHPLVLLDDRDAEEYGEEPLQLIERARYEYRLKPAPGAPADLALLSRRGVQPSLLRESESDRGLIEPGDYCGVLSLVVVRRSDLDERPIAQASVEVRSSKLGYRDHYRGMLALIAEKSAGLLIDSRAPTVLRLETLWQRDSRIVEQQLEFLRQTLESSLFRGALDEILRNPHRRLESESKQQPISRPVKPDRAFARQISAAKARVSVPEDHPLSAISESLPATIRGVRRIDFMDTVENRFAKMVLTEFRDFLASIALHLSGEVANRQSPEAQRLLRESSRLTSMLNKQLDRGFFPDVSRPDFIPLASPVLQRKAGYRELLRFWLQFHAGAQLVWDGGPDVFHAGARDVATLYEYWLFFHLESLFRTKFSCEQPLHAIIIDRQRTPAQLTLKRGVQLSTPIAGAWSEIAGRRLNGEFHFNRKFPPKSPRNRSGSWTRGAQPDFTISFWPAGYSRQQAEEDELMVHVHFDAKYRVEHVREVLGDDLDDAEFEQTALPREEGKTAAKYSDLLKMHAYRDAIRRTAGAYVLYPGRPGDDKTYQGFHEVLPGLGAFAIRPDRNGKPEGIDALSRFLDRVIAHLANQASARERVTYHLADAYSSAESGTTPGAVQIEERDALFGGQLRAVPPAEHMVLIAWYRDPEQVELARLEHGLAFVRLGRRRGSLHVHPNLSRIRHLALRSNRGTLAPGLVKLTEPGFRVYTRKDLATLLRKLRAKDVLAAWQRHSGEDDSEYLYAVFRTTDDADYARCVWDSALLTEKIERFESDRRNKPVTNLGRSSPEPRVLPLSDLLDARNGF